VGAVVGEERLNGEGDAPVRTATVSYSGLPYDVLSAYDASTGGRFAAGDGIDVGDDGDAIVLVAYDYERDEPLYDRPVGVEIQSFSGFDRWDAIPSFGSLWRLEGTASGGGAEEGKPLGELLEEAQRKVTAGSASA
jgi:hypothetical protein